ncbi:hypothetical protein KJ996_06335, partial [Patescibacteria group bacterium]|nr:hypothetical protein [Patescibacteria group bacterium]
MKGIYYCRQDGTDRDDWHQPVAGETIILPRKGFTAHFPNVEIQGGIEWRCEEWAASERCDGCMDSCGNVQLKFDGEGEFAVSYVNDKPNRFIREFRWGWSGHGTNEWWFDSGAISLKAPREDYRSGSGLTASSSRIVAYNRNVGVDCFREDCGDEVSFPEGGGITAGFVNADGGYRANWTGFAVSQNFITDQLDELIKIELGEREPVEPTVCRHNRQVQVGILTNDSKKVSYFLCLACRQKGVRWEEFTRRNQRDICPYFRRACKGVTEKLDQFPDWFRWDGDNLLSAHRRMQDDGWEAYEVTYVRRKEGFVRRAVLLFNLRTRETWMYRYAGFIPNTIQVFRDKFSEGRRILGYGGTGRNKDQANWDDP